MQIGMKTSRAQFILALNHDQTIIRRSSVGINPYALARRGWWRRVQVGDRVSGVSSGDTERLEGG